MKSQDISGLRYSKREREREKERVLVLMYGSFVSSL